MDAVQRRLGGKLSVLGVVPFNPQPPALDSPGRKDLLPLQVAPVETARAHWPGGPVDGISGPLSPEGARLGKFILLLQVEPGGNVWDP